MKEIISTLRVNVKSLAAESTIIRNEIRKVSDEFIKNSLHLHRVKNVRIEARHTQLALAAVKNKNYASVEGLAKTEPNWSRILQKIVRHTNDEDIKENVCKWCNEGKMFWKAKASQNET